MTTRIKLRRDTAANWTTSNPILAAGEPGLETDTGKIKYGNGVSRWNVLEHSGGDTLTNDGSITVQTGDADRWFVRLRREDSTSNPQYTGVVVNSTNYDSEGNAIVVATLGLSDAGIAVFKFTSAGELVWKKSIDAVDSSWYIESNAVVDADDNIIFAVNSDSGTSKSIIKINGETGAVLFSENLAFTENFEIKAIAVDSNSNIIIGGQVWWPDNNNETAFVAKLNSTADSITWQKTLSVENRFSYINALEVDFNDDIVVAGYYDYDYVVDGNPVQDDVMMVAKITSAGDVSWKKGVTPEDFSEGRVTGISLDSLGNIYATGTYYVGNPTDNSNFFSNGNKSNAVVIFKMTTLGGIVWDRRVGPGQCSWVGVSTAVGEDGDLYLYASTYQRNPAGETDNGASGYWNATLALGRYNKTTGAVIWQSYFDNPKSQEVPAWGNNAPWDNEATDLMTVKNNKILIGGSVRLGQSDADQNSPWSTGGDYFNQGFLAQFDTEATRFSAEGWTLETSRIPGKLTNTLVTLDSDLALQTSGVAITNEGSPNIETLAVGVSVRRTASKTNTWTFGKDGTFSAPDDANIKLNQKQLGYASLYGILNNTDDDIWFESVTHDADGFTYALGSDQWGNNSAHIYKFTPEGALVWATQLFSGDGATFYVEWSGGEYTVATVDQGGSGYKVGDKIVISGGQFGGTDGVNSLTLEVATLNGDTDFIGGVATVTIVGGVAPAGTSTASGVTDYYDNANCEVRSITFDPVTGNPVVLISTPTYNGNTLDNEWTETVLLLIDSGSGAVISTNTLSDEGDIYANDVAVSATGEVAVVGEKYNEYNVYGAITPLTGSSVDSMWVDKADIDAEHFPGEPNGNYSDWFITGTGITDQAQIQNVNYYTGLTGTTRQGSGAEFTVEVTGGSSSIITGTMDVGTDGNAQYGFNTATPFGAASLTPDGVITGIAYTGTVTYVGLTSGTTGGITVVGGVSINGSSTFTLTVDGISQEFTMDIMGTYVAGDPFGLATKSTQTLTVDLSISSARSYSVLITAGGSNYLPGHKVKVLGSALGGTTPENDMIITVAGTSEGAIGSVSNAGTPNASAVGPYTAVAFTNYNAGSGANFLYQFDAATGVVYNSGGDTQVGQNYVTGDVITIPGTSFAGGASPANDITVTVGPVGSSGDIQNPVAFNGVVNTSFLKLSTNASVNFAAEGASFAIKQSLGAEAFIWTPAFNKAIGGNNSDWFTGVVWDAAGDNVYAVGQGRYDVTYDQALVVKYSSTGTLVASKFINGDMGNYSAERGAVALMANDSIVVVHDMYNTYRDNTDEILVTKLDSDLNIVWQQFIGIETGDGYESPESNINVAVDIATDEILITWEVSDWTDLIDDQAVHIVKLDTDGEVLWKRIFGIHESDTELARNGNGNKFVSIHGDHFTIVGHTDGPNDQNFNAFIATLPLDGTGVGLHGFWTYAELNDDRIKVWRLSGRTSTTFTPNVHSSAITSTTNVKHYYTDYQQEQFTLYPQVIRSNEGGAVEFADGSKQTFSTALVPQVRISAGSYTIRPEDSGRHILIEQSNYAVVIPNWQKVKLPVGFTFTIVNVSGNTCYLANESVNSGRGEMWFSGGNNKTSSIYIDDNGSGQMVTLLKIKEGTYSDDGDQHGDIWMVAGADIGVD